MEIVTSCTEASGYQATLCQQAEGGGWGKGDPQATSCRMSSCLQSMSHYSSLQQANRDKEILINFEPECKFKPYSWLCTTKEDSYSNKTLIGNWNQERFDLRTLQERKPLPSQYAHYYQTSYASEYPEQHSLYVRKVLQKEPHCFPGHQPELNPPQSKPHQMSSCYMIEYTSPCPLPRNPCSKQEVKEEATWHPTP
ncbi:cilia- and flagella-associated protein 68 isoform X1 [Ascaphus truei]|uniref:cilia- and flagella-associated protein 68 isoform X1 n=2 Tax=Ascaphus truei TaxID=8439 RepID=UPI003F5ABD61